MTSTFSWRCISNTPPGRTVSIPKSRNGPSFKCPGWPTGIISPVATLVKSPRSTAASESIARTRIDDGSCAASPALAVDAATPPPDAVPPDGLFACEREAPPQPTRARLTTRHLRMRGGGPKLITRRMLARTLVDCKTEPRSGSSKREPNDATPALGGSENKVCVGRLRRPDHSAGGLCPAGLRRFKQLPWIRSSLRTFCAFGRLSGHGE